MPKGCRHWLPQASRDSSVHQGPNVRGRPWGRIRLVLLNLVERRRKTVPLLLRTVLLVRQTRRPGLNGTSGPSTYRHTSSPSLTEAAQYLLNQYIRQMSGWIIDQQRDFRRAQNGEI